jgi:hypothetical protein
MGSLAATRLAEGDDQDHDGHRPGQVTANHPSPDALSTTRFNR